MTLNSISREDEQLAVLGLLGMAVKRFTGVAPDKNWKRLKSLRPSYKTFGTDAGRYQGQFFMKDDLSKFTVVLHCDPEELMTHKALLTRSDNLEIIGSGYLSYNLCSSFLAGCLSTLCKMVLEGPLYTDLVAYSSTAPIGKVTKKEIVQYKRFPVALGSGRLTWSSPECVNHNDHRIQFELIHKARRVVVKLEAWDLQPPAPLKAAPSSRTAKKRHAAKQLPTRKQQRAGKTAKKTHCFAVRPST